MLAHFTFSVFFWKSLFTITGRQKNNKINTKRVCEKNLTLQSDFIYSHFYGRTTKRVNVTNATPAHWVGRNPCPIFIVCGPKFFKLSEHAQERLRFAAPFTLRYLVSFRRYSQSGCEVVQNLPKILTFLAANFFGEGSKISDPIL